MKTKIISKRKVLILENDFVKGQVLISHAEMLGLEATLCKDFDSFEDEVGEEDFDFALVNIDEDVDSIGPLAVSLEDSPIIVMSDDPLFQVSRPAWPTTVKGFVGMEASPAELMATAFDTVTAEWNRQSRPHYLMIDDDEAFGRIVTRVAETLGIRITYFATLEEAQSSGSLSAFDGVLLDYDLDTTTGFAVAEILNVTAQRKPIVMISASNRPEQDNLSQLPNIVGFVSKWENAHEFVDKSSNAIQNRLKNAA